MWSLLRSLGSLSFGSIYYAFLMGYYTWMVMPLVLGSFAGYKFYSFYQTTQNDRYAHSKLHSPQGRRAGQATSEFVDWLGEVGRALGSLSILGTLVRSRLGITKKAPLPGSVARRPTSNERIEEVKASLQAAASSSVPAIRKTRSLRRHNEPAVVESTAPTDEPGAKNDGLSNEATSETTPTPNPGNETTSETVEPNKSTDEPNKSTDEPNESTDEPNESTKEGN